MDAPSILADVRRRSGLTTRQLARRAGTSHSAVTGYERGWRVPSAGTLLRLVAACGFDLEVEVHARGPVEDRPRRGRELIEVLELAEQFPAAHGEAISGRFPSR